MRKLEEFGLPFGIHFKYVINVVVNLDSALHEGHIQILGLIRIQNLQMRHVSHVLEHILAFLRENIGLSLECDDIDILVEYLSFWGTI